MTNTLGKKWYHMTQELTVCPMLVDLGTPLFVAIRCGKEMFGLEYLKLTFRRLMSTIVDVPHR